MKKLINYLNKNGVDFRPVSYGSNYFYNAPALEFDGIIASFDYTSGNYYKASADLAKLEKYCARYGYSVFNRGVNPKCIYIHIMKTVVLSLPAAACCNYLIINGKADPAEQLTGCLVLLIPESLKEYIKRREN